MARTASELAHLFRALKAPAAARALPVIADRAACSQSPHADNEKASRRQASPAADPSSPQAIDPTPRTPNDPAQQRPINGRGLICGASGELVARARRPASSAR